MALTVTDSATAALKEVLENVEHEPEQVLRLVFDGQGELNLALDSEKEEDQVVEQEGAKIMVIEPDVGEKLEGAVLDVKESEEGMAFTIRPPEGEEDEEAE
ncbi:MAG: iron-sulfur cluster biosynthesis family protein [Candidatus Hydrogenedentota bacterium]